MAETVDVLWTDDELASSVEAYIFMLRLERAGLPFRKEAASELLLTGPLSIRNDASIRYRMRNISAVIVELGGPVLSAYSPAERVGQNVRRRLRTMLSEHPGFKKVLDKETHAPRPHVTIAEAPRAEALARLEALREYVADLERELLGIGHNGPPEPLSLNGPARENFERVQESILALEVEVRKPSPDPKVAEQNTSRLLEFGLKVMLWLGERGTKFADATLKVLAPVLVAKATGLMPLIIDAAKAVGQAIAR